jgi:hypothetical protein
MDANTLNDLASSLAVLSVTGDRAPLEKAAADYLKQADLMQQLQGYGNQAADYAKGLYAQAQPHLADPYVRNSLIGLGAGGLVGMMQPKRKLRSALTYGLVGGLGGLGLAHALNGGQLPAGGGGNAAASADRAARVQAANTAIVAEGKNPGARQLAGQVAGFATAVPAYGVIRDRLIARNGMRNLYNVPETASRATREIAQRVQPQGDKFVFTANEPSELKRLSAAKLEANRLAKPTLSQRTLAGTGAGVVGILSSLGMGRLGEWAANYYNKPLYDAKTRAQAQ